MYSSQRIDPERLFTPVRQALTAGLVNGAPLVVALDDTLLRKSGRKTHGVKYIRDPMGPPFNVNFIKAQRFVQVSMASPGDNGMARMIPIDFVHAPTPLKVRANADEPTRANYRKAKREMALPKVGADRLHVLRKAMDDEGQRDRSLWSVVDGGYTNRTFIKHLPERTVMIGRIRADAKLYHMPEPEEGKVGRHNVYGRRAPTPEALRKDNAVPWKGVEVFAAVYGPHVKGVTEYERNVFSVTEVGQPIPTEDTLTGYDESVAIKSDNVEEGLGLCSYILV